MYLVLLIVFLGFATVVDGTLADLHIRTTYVTQFDYGPNARFKIYRDSKNSKTPSLKNRYYVHPLTVLVTKEAKCYIDKYAPDDEQNQLQIPVIMWTNAFQETAWKSLRDYTDTPNMRKFQIQMLPINIYRFNWDMNRNNGLRLDKTWHGYGKRLNEIMMTIFVSKTYDGGCSALEEIIKTNGNWWFDRKDPVLEVSLDTQRKVSKRVQISSKDILRTNFFTKMNHTVQKQKLEGVEHPPVYLASHDVTNFAKEISENVLVNTQTDVGYKNSKETRNFVKKIVGLITAASTKLSSTKLPLDGWGSVFWDKDNSRPDQVASQVNKLNKFYKHSTKTERNETNSNSTSVEKAKVDKGGLDIGVFDLKIGGHLDFDSTTKRVTVRRNEISELKKEHNECAVGKVVKWDGKRFIPRPMDLYRVNTNNISTSLSLVSLDVQVSNDKSVLPIPLLSYETIFSD